MAHKQSPPQNVCVSLRPIHQTHHSTQQTAPHTPRTLTNHDFWVLGGLNVDHILHGGLDWSTNTPASGLLDLGILVPSSAILPLAMLEPKYSMVPRLLCSLRALRESPNRSPSSISTNYSHNDTEVCATLDQMLAYEKRRPSTFGIWRQSVTNL